MKGNSKELALYYKELLQNGHNSDVIIRFGQGESLEKLYAHSLILRTRSTFFDTALSSRWAKKEGNSFIIEMKDVSINIFKAVLSYIYTTEISLNELDGFKILEFLVEIDKLLLSEEIDSKLFSSIQGRLEELIQSDAIKVLQIVFQYNIFESLREPSLKLICAHPDEIFEHSNNWEKNDYNIFKEAINEFIPLIRWFHISKKEFKQHKKFLENILSKDLFNNILNYQHDPNSVPTKAGVLKSRKLFYNLFKNESNYVLFSSYDDLVNINKRLFEIKDQYDVIIRVGEGNKDPFIFTVENISATIFEVILRYLYITEIDFENLDGINILMLIEAANRMDLGVIITNLLSSANFAVNILRKL
ncbi:484_t:CDS:2, partial [Dentiscutata heterogama]